MALCDEVGTEWTVTEYSVDAEVSETGWRVYCVRLPGPGLLIVRLMRWPTLGMVLSLLIVVSSVLCWIWLKWAGVVLR